MKRKKKENIDLFRFTFHTCWAEEGPLLTLLGQKIIYRNVRSEHSLLLIIITARSGSFCCPSSFHQVCEVDDFLPGKCALQNKQNIYQKSNAKKEERKELFQDENWNFRRVAAF